MSENKLVFEKDGTYHRGAKLEELKVESAPRAKSTGATSARPAKVASVGAPSAPKKTKQGGFDLSSLRSFAAKASANVSKTTLPKQGAKSLGKVKDVPRAGDTKPKVEKPKPEVKMPTVVESKQPEPVNAVAPAVENSQPDAVATKDKIPTAVFAVQTKDGQAYYWNGEAFVATPDFTPAKLGVEHLAGGFYADSKQRTFSAIEAIAIINVFTSMGLEVETVSDAGNCSCFVAKNSHNQTFSYSGGDWVREQDDVSIAMEAPTLCAGVVAVRVAAEGTVEVRTLAGMLTTIVEGTKVVEDPVKEPETEVEPESEPAEEPSVPSLHNLWKQYGAAGVKETEVEPEPVEEPSAPVSLNNLWKKYGAAYAAGVKEMKLDARTEEEKAADEAVGFTGHGFHLVSAEEFYKATKLSDYEVVAWCHKCMKAVVSAPGAILSLAREPKVRFYNFITTQNRDTVDIVLGFGDMVGCFSVNLKTAIVNEAVGEIAIKGEDIVSRDGDYMAIYSERLRSTTVV